MITISPHAWCKGTKFASTKYLFGMWTLPSWKKKKKIKTQKTQEEMLTFLLTA